MKTNNYFNAFILVFLAGLFWSFGVVTVRYMVDAHDYVFQYLFYRGISIAIILLIYLFIRDGLNFYQNFFRIGISSVLGGIFLDTYLNNQVIFYGSLLGSLILFLLGAIMSVTAIILFSMANLIQSNK